ncbi:MAG: FtsX-like permease family protein, partial [Chloroflexota bacterium]
ALDPINQAFRPPLIDGRWLSTNVQAVLGVNDALLREETDMQIGEWFSFEIKGEIINLQLIGVVEEARSVPTLYLNYRYFSNAFDEVGQANAAWIEIDNPDQVQGSIKAIEAMFEYRNFRVARIVSAGEEKQFFEEHFGLITGFLTIASILLAIVGGLGLMGTMSINVIERVREIGVMRSLGASNRVIQRIFVAEGLIIGLISWGLSLIAGLIPTKLLGDAVGIAFMETPLTYTLSINGIVAWLAIVLIVSALSTSVPAEQASQIKVSELLAYE